MSKWFSLQILKLRSNEIVDVHDLAFNGLNRLKKLDISRNNLVNAPSLSCVKSTLEELNLAWNKISHISDTYFNLCRKIELLSLHYNQLYEIPNARSISNTIIYLSLAGNNISSGIPMYGIYFPRLYELQISSNRLTHFCFPPTQFAPRLRRVFLESNNLSMIYFTHTYSSIRHDVLITLGHNPWHCDGSQLWIQECSLGSHGDMMCMGWLKVTGMVCASPPNVTGLPPIEAGMKCSYVVLSSCFTAKPVCNDHLYNKIYYL